MMREVSISPAYNDPGAKKLNTMKNCTMHQLFFMTQTHIEVCTESFKSEGIMLSLAVMG